jgi:hypothetical protein
VFSRDSRSAGVGGNLVGWWTGRWGIVGFLFGLPKIEEQQAEARKRHRRVIPSTSLDQINDWLTKAIVGVGLVEAQRIIAWGAKVAGRIGEGMAGQQSSTGSAFAAALLIAFPILGFITSYLVTRTFIALALARADVATSDAANQGAQSEQAVFQINDEEFEALDSAPLHLGEEPASADPRVDEAVEKIVSHPLDSLLSWKHIRLWAKAKLLSALQAQGDQAKALAAEAEKGYAKAIGLVPNDAETRLGMAVAMTTRDAPKREVLKQLEAARDCLMAKSEPDLRKNVFKSLAYRYLYLPEPESFQRTIEAAREYFAKPCAIPSGGMWVNVACAYGLAIKC